ncbi:hypothetical protein BDN72DRAFT_884220 [Pluteus cervinus]|uniref:Uncharacterized protein n=1 Tax=Pluteus cervinus TaxID=181527 RepID=A0ACD2ZYB9_9AGAR|nr:hypothetical protein BDN72DRAFT_884220 [Pluteus cervinus]
MSSPQQKPIPDPTSKPQNKLFSGSASPGPKHPTFGIFNPVSCHVTGHGTVNNNQQYTFGATTFNHYYAPNTTGSNHDTRSNSSIGNPLYTQSPPPGQAPVPDSFACGRAPAPASSTFTGTGGPPETHPFCHDLQSQPSPATASASVLAPSTPMQLDCLGTVPLKDDQPTASAFLKTNQDLELDDDIEMDCDAMP